MLLLGGDINMGLYEVIYILENYIIFPLAVFTTLFMLFWLVRELFKEEEGYF